jgi:NodT family efflux transporter outer membrane factor (OMF) lipoprotein
MKKYSNTMAIMLGMAITLSGCSGHVASHDEAVQSIASANQKDKRVANSWSAAESGGLVDDGWLQSFNDPQLLELVSEAEANNFGLKISAAKLQQAEALARQSGAALKPSVGLSGAYSDRNSDALGELYGGGLKVSWEADVWGRVGSAVAGAEEAAEASQSDFEFARQSLAAATANGWFLATGSKVLTDYAGQVVQLLEQTVKIAMTKESVGQGTMQSVHLAKADLASAQEAERKALSAQENAKRSLELLLGRYPAAELETADTITAVPPPVAAGIPSEILERRPDLIAAESRVAAAFYKQQEAELLHLPRFNFSIGLSINNLTNAISNLAAGIFAPLYTGGAIEAEVERATAVQQEAIASYGQTALTAFKEVETALAGEEHLAKRQEYLQTVVEENFKAYGLVKTQYDVGKIDMLDLLSVQNKWIQARIALVDVETQRLLNRTGLHLALGGSFE